MADDQKTVNEQVAAAENDKKEQTLTALYAKQREMKNQLLQAAYTQKEADYKEYADEAQPAWDKVYQMLDEFMYNSHGYGASWGRLFNFVWVLNAALAKQDPITSGRTMEFITPIAKEVLGVAGGVVGGLVGGLGTMFGVGDGVMGGAARGYRVATGTPNEEVQYFVDIKKDGSGSLDYWLNRTEGQKFTPDEVAAYQADIGCWLAGQGYEPVPNEPWTYKAKTDAAKKRGELKVEGVFAGLRDDPETGLAVYFTNKQMQVKQTKAAEQVEAPAMRM